MAYLGQIDSFSQWLLMYEDLNFLPADVELVKGKLLFETSGRQCFRFLEGSGRKSPRFRAKEGNGVILQYLGGQRYLARAVGSKATQSATNCYCYDDIHRFRKCIRQDPKSADHFKFLLLDDSLPYPQNSKVVFEWTLTSGPRDQRETQTIETGPSYSRSGSRVVSARKDIRTPCEVACSRAAHFESYVSCRKRFVVVVGPPCLNHTQEPLEEEKEEEEKEKKAEEETDEQSYQPSNCIFDATDFSMKVFHLRNSCGSADEQVKKLWSANVAFDPRPFREHVAAIVASADAYDYLPRCRQTGSLLLLDVLRHRVLYVMQDRLCFSTDLQYTCTGEQLLTSISHDDVITSRPIASLSDDAISSERRPSLFALLSADDLSLLRILSLSPTSVLTPVLSSITSWDFRSFALFLWNGRKALGPGASHLASLDASWPIDVANFCFPSEIDSLLNICSGVVRKLVGRKEMIDYLPIPKVVASRLKEL